MENRENQVSSKTAVSLAHNRATSKHINLTITVFISPQVIRNPTDFFEEAVIGTEVENVMDQLKVNNKDYTETAWEGIVGAVDAAQGNRQHIVESEHLMKSLLEQKDGLARRIPTKAGLDNTSALQATDNFIAKQLKVVGDIGCPVLGSHLSSSLDDDARKYKKDDDFVSV